MPAYTQGGVYRERIGEVPQAFWVIPEAYGTHAVRAKVEEYTGDARRARKTPVLTVYGIPGRDCGMYSSGNPLTTAAEYRGWIKQLARGLEGTKALVVLEPDALPLFSSSVQACPEKPRRWKGMLAFASKRLSDTGAWVYLDAGHSNWTPYDDRPTFLRAAGVRYARGISTNVSNFRPTADEKAYAQEMLRGLRKLGIRGKRYVVDTSRNGATPSSDGYDVINPRGPGSARSRGWSSTARSTARCGSSTPASPTAKRSTQAIGATTSPTGCSTVASPTPAEPASRRREHRAAGLGSGIVRGLRGLMADTRPLRNEHFRRLWLANIITVIAPSSRSSRCRPRSTR